jgi:hypothetical protein
MLWVLFAVVGIPLTAIGVVLRLCESSWEKPSGSMGSTWFMAIGFLLCMPALLYFVPAIIDHIRSHL